MFERETREFIYKETLDKAPCPTCRRRQHVHLEVMLRHKWRTDEGEEGIDDYRIVRCGGCHTFFYWRMMKDIYYVTDNDGEIVDVGATASQFFPLPELRSRPLWLNTSLRAKHGTLAAILDDLYLLIDQGMSIYAAMGIRTCFDISAELLGVDASLPFAKKIERLEVDGHISPREKTLLSDLVNIGSAAIHRGFKPDERDIDLLMDALEGFIQRAIILPERLDDLSSRVPKRMTVKSGKI